MIILLGSLLMFVICCEGRILEEKFSPTAIEELSLEPFDVPVINRTERGSRIVFGTFATTGQFPHYTLIFIKRPKATFQCGGGLIALNWVLTANHCVKDAQSIEMRFGLTQRNAYEQMSMAHSIIRNSVVDIALIKLKTSIRITSAVDIVSLPRYAERNELYANRLGTVCGMGIEDQRTNAISTNLKYAELKILTQSDCRPYYGYVDPKVLCAKSSISNASTCPGDSGSPLIVKDNNKNVIVGVVSFGSATGCDVGYPVGYVRTTHQLDWIVYYTSISLRN